MTIVTGPKAAGRCWVNTVSREHVEVGRAGGFTQADHGAATRLRRLGKGDGIVFYSPRTAMRSGTPLQRFTAIGLVADDEPYRVTMSADIHPWRRSVEFVEAQEAEAKPLVAHLSFVPDPRHWGMPFRRGLFEVPESDFAAIAGAMGLTWPHAD